mgnify:CR=1 FL=1
MSSWNTVQPRIDETRGMGGLAEWEVRDYKHQASGTRMDLRMLLIQRRAIPRELIL